MALKQGLAVNSVTIDAPDQRLAMAGLLVRETSHRVRSGIFGTKVRNILTPRSDFKVDVAFFNAVLSRSESYGALLFANDGTAQFSFDGAPTANSRVDVMYAFYPDSTQGEPGGSPSLQVKKGDAGASPQKPSIPAGAFEIGTAQIPSTATGMTSANVIITPTFKFTSVQGGRIPFRSLADIQAETALPEGTLAYLDGVANPRTYRYDGSAWRLWEQTPQDMTLTLSVAGLNMGSAGNVTFTVSVSAGTVRIEFRGRFSGTGPAWGDVRYSLPYPAFGVFATTPAAAGGTAGINDSDGGTYSGLTSLIGDGTWRMWRTGTSNGSSGTWGNTQPFNPATGDSFAGFLTYTAA